MKNLLFRTTGNIVEAYKGYKGGYERISSDICSIDDSDLMLIDMGSGYKDFYMELNCIRNSSVSAVGTEERQFEYDGTDLNEHIVTDASEIRLSPFSCRCSLEITNDVDVLDMRNSLDVKLSIVTKSFNTAIHSVKMTAGSSVCIYSGSVGGRNIALRLSSGQIAVCSNFFSSMTVDVEMEELNDNRQPEYFGSNVLIQNIYVEPYRDCVFDMTNLCTVNPASVKCLTVYVRKCCNVLEWLFHATGFDNGYSIHDSLGTLYEELKQECEPFMQYEEPYENTLPKLICSLVVSCKPVRIISYYVNYNGKCFKIEESSSESSVTISYLKGG